MAKYIPSESIVRTPVDEIGSLLDIPRIQNESLVDYSKRLYDTYANRASSTYEGLINGINRELGLVKKQLLKVYLKDIGFGIIDNTNVVLSQTTLTNNLSYTNTIDGLTVIAVGNKLTDTTQSWTSKTLRGLKLKVNGEIYRIKDNDETNIYIDGELSAVVGFPYLIEADYEDNILIGLGLKIGNRLYKISSNNGNIIQVEGGNLFDSPEQEYRIIAYNPRLDITASKIILYKDYTNERNFQLERSIDLREDVKFHADVVNEINTLEYFEAENLTTVKESYFAFSLKKQSSEHVVIKEIVPVSNFFKLENSSIKQGSIKFTESNVFLRETNEDEVSERPGNYFVDYSNGIVISNSTPSGVGTVSYTWSEFPFTVIQSPVVVNALPDRDTQDFLFNQIQMDIYDNARDKYISGQPNADMIENIAELLNVKPQNWGK